MTYQEWKTKNLGQTIGYPDGQYVGECLSEVKKYIKDCFGINPPSSGVTNPPEGAAFGYWTKFLDPLGTVFEKIPNTPTGVPKQGDIVVWEAWSGSKWGHIAIFDNGDANSFQSLDQNWSGKQVHLQSHNYTSPKIIGWLHPKGSEDIMRYDLFRDPPGAIYERLNNYALVHIPDPAFLKRYYGDNPTITQVDDVWSVGWIAEDPRPLKERITGLENQTKTQQDQINTLTQKVTDIQAELTASHKYVSDLNTQIEKDIAEYDTKIDEITKDKQIAEQGKEIAETALVEANKAKDIAEEDVKTRDELIQTQEDEIAGLKKQLPTGDSYIGNTGVKEPIILTSINWFNKIKYWLQELLKKWRNR